MWRFLWRVEVGAAAAVGIGYSSWLMFLGGEYRMVKISVYAELKFLFWRICLKSYTMFMTFSSGNIDTACIHYLHWQTISTWTRGVNIFLLFHNCVLLWWTSGRYDLWPSLDSACFKIVALYLNWTLTGVCSFATYSGQVENSTNLTRLQNFILNFCFWTLTVHTWNAEQSSGSSNLNKP